MNLPSCLRRSPLGPSNDEGDGDGPGDDAEAHGEKTGYARNLSWDPIAKDRTTAFPSKVEPLSRFVVLVFGPIASLSRRSAPQGTKVAHDGIVSISS